MGFISAIVLIISVLPGWAAESSPKPAVMAVIDIMPKGEFEEKRMAFLKEQMKSCGNCEIRNITPYGPNGVPKKEEFGAVLEKASEEASFIFLPWNEKNQTDWAPFVESMKKVTTQGTVILAFAGRPPSGNPPALLNRTVMGQVPGVFIVGELTEQERLPEGTFFGPELLTAVKPPKDLTGKDKASDLFATKLLQQWNKKSSTEWASFLKTKKVSSRKIWPGMDDFFPR